MRQMVVECVLSKINKYIYAKTSLANGDSRGSFVEMYNHCSIYLYRLNFDLIQDNHLYQQKVS